MFDLIEEFFKASGKTVVFCLIALLIIIVNMVLSAIFDKDGEGSFL